MAKQFKAKTKSKLNQTEKKEEIMPTIEDTIDLNDAEDFKLPSAGVHNGNLAGVELTTTKKNPNKEQFILTVTLSPEDPDAPNLPMRLYLGWPLPEEKEVYWGTRTAYGAQIKSLKDALTAFGGQESGGIDKNKVLAFLNSKIGMVVKVKVKQELRVDPLTKEPVDPPEFQASIDKLLPA